MCTFFMSYEIFQSVVTGKQQLRRLKFFWHCIVTGFPAFAFTLLNHVYIYMIKSRMFFQFLRFKQLFCGLLSTKNFIKCTPILLSLPTNKQTVVKTVFSPKEVITAFYDSLFKTHLWLNNYGVVLASFRLYVEKFSFYSWYLNLVIGWIRTWH